MDDGEAFDSLVSGADSALLVVTTASGGERAGCVLGFHSQCSIEPRRYAVWLSKANHTTRVAIHATHLAVHFLGAEDHDLVELFGELTGDDVDKFERCQWVEGAGGVPLLERCQGRFEGRRTTLLDDGSDHICVVLEPVEAWSPPDLQPLRLSQVADLEPGHQAEERPKPADERTT